jgi:lipoprotein NlpI
VQYGRDRGTKGDVKGAMAAFEQAIQVDPKYEPGYFNRGYGYVIQNKLKEAMADFDQAILLDPTDAHAYYQRGCIRGMASDFDGAISDFNSVIKIDPKIAAAYYNLGHVEYFKGNLDDASSHVDTAINLDATSYFAFYIRGLILQAQGDKPGALAAFQKSASLGYPYGALWAWVIEMESRQEGLAQQELINASVNSHLIRPNTWPSPIADFLLKRISQEDMLNLSSSGDPNSINNQLSEAWFFIGVQKRTDGDAPSARDAFTAAVKTGAKSSEEFVEANRQLEKLNAQGDQ